MTTARILTMRNFAIAVKNGLVQWQRHSLERLLVRNINRKAIFDALTHGTIIETYTDDMPFPSVLIVYLKGKIPLHVVAAFDKNSKTAFIITAYEPTLEHFMPDFKTRRLK